VVSKRKSRSSARKCDRLSGIVVWMIILGFLTSGLSCSKSSIIYVDDSKSIAFLDVNEPAPFPGVLITEGRYEEFLDFEEEVYEKLR